MLPIEITQHVFAQPFRPFRILLKEGGKHDVDEYTMVRISTHALQVRQSSGWEFSIDWPDVSGVVLLPEGELTPKKDPYRWPA